jgi:hypothetical protein
MGSAVKRNLSVSVMNLIVDMAPDGMIYGIELLNANKQLQREDMGRLLVLNEATGEKMEFPLQPCSHVGWVKFMKPSDTIRNDRLNYRE